MFYHVEGLRRHGGKFGTPWLAATSPKSLNKRDYTVFNVTEAANGLRAVVIGEKLSAQDHRPRYSLYLSSQLMFGLVRILEKQIDSILKAAELLAESLHGSYCNAIRIGRKGRHLSEQVLPNIDADPNLLNIEYGLYDILDPIPPHELPDVSVWNWFDLTDMEEQRGISPASFNKHSRLQACLRDITLKEPTFESSRDFGILPDDLPIQNELDLMETFMQVGLQEDPFGLELHDKKRDTTPTPLETEPLKEPAKPKKARKDRHKESDTTTHTAQVEKPSIVTRLQLSELDPNEPAQHQRQRRARHLAIDFSVSLDRRTMYNHMANTEPTLGTKASRFPKFVEKMSEIMMFKEPARKNMTGSLLRELWTSATIVHVKHLDEQSSESLESGVKSSQDGSITQLPANVILEHPSQEELIHLPVEQQREASKLTEESSLIGESLKLPDELRGNTSSSRSIRASSVKSAHTEPSRHDSTQEIVVPPDLKPLDDTPVNIRDDSQSLTVMHFDSIMMKLEACAGETTFEDICPLDAYADVASLMFIALLNGATRGIWEVEQAEAFGKIIIHQVLVGAVHLSC